MVPLFINTETICEPGVALANVKEATERGYPRLVVSDEIKDRPISICGAGPSLAKTRHDVVGDVMACNSAIAHLDRNGIKVDFGFLWDADPIVAKFAHRVVGCTYYVASRCDPGVFDTLEGMKVVLWHATGDYGLLEMLADMPGECDQPCVNGGSAAVTRAIYLAYALGYRDIHLHGADSSWGYGELNRYGSHVDGSLVHEDKINVKMGGNQSWFHTTGWLAAQAQEFSKIYDPLTNMGAKFTVHGTGLLPSIWEAMRAERS